MRRTILCLCVGLLAACTSVKTDTLYLVSPHIQSVSGQPAYTPTEAIGFAFYASSTSWAPASYAQAEAGVLENLRTGELRGYNLHSELDTAGKISFRLTSSPAILVVCDPINRLYAWREVSVPENLPQMLLPVYFRLWRTQSLYTDSGWTVVNDFTEESETQSLELPLRSMDDL